jgi:hypothetical protein
MTAIADLVSLLIEQRCSADVVRSVVDLAQRHAAEMVAACPTIVRQSADVGGLSSDTAYQRRKEYDRNRQAEIRRLRRLSEKPPLILSSCSSDSKKLSEEGSKKERRVRARKSLGPLPENWQPPDIAHGLATECGTTVAYVDGVFRDYLKSSGKLYADHDAAFCNFVRNQRKFNGNTHGQQQPAKRGIIQAADDLCRKVASFDGPSKSDIVLRDGEGEATPRLLSNR